LGPCAHQAERVAPAGEVAVGEVELEPILADARRVVVAALERRGERQLLVEGDPQVGVAGALPGEQLRLDLADARVLLEQLELALEVRDVERRVCGAQNAGAQVSIAEPAVALEVELREAPLDDLEVDDTAVDLLIGKDRARIHIAGVDVQARELLAQLLEILGAKGASLEGSGDC